MSERSWQDFEDGEGAGPPPGERGPDPMSLRQAYAGPVVLLLPIFVCALVVVHLMTRPRMPAGGPVDVTASGVASVQGFEGRLDLGERGELRARLTPLHAVPERQRFDAAALAQRFELTQGAPWRLELSWSESSEGQVQGAVPLGTLAVVDASGGRAGPLFRALPAIAEQTAPDPLTALLTPPQQALQPGDSAQLVLWGPEPGLAPRLELEGVGGRSLVLSAAEFPFDDLPRFLASLDVEPVEQEDDPR